MDGIHPPLSVDLDRAEILILSPPSSYPPCSSFKPSFWAVTVPSTSNRRHFAPLSSCLFTRFDVTHAMLYFLSPFPVIYLSRDEVDQSVRFLYDLTGKYFSNVSRESGLFHVTFSQLFEWKKVGKSVSIWSLFVFSLFDFLEFSFRGSRREIFAPNIRRSSLSSARTKLFQRHVDRNLSHW